MSSREVGNYGENEAVQYLQEKGYRILERNYRLKMGEIDIVATKDDFLIFVEVKLRKSDGIARPAAAVGWAKQKKIIKTSLHYMQTRNEFEKMVRYDVIEIAGNRLNHIESAFEYNGNLGY